MILPESLPEGWAVFDAEDAGAERPGETAAASGGFLHWRPIHTRHDPVHSALPLAGQFHEDRWHRLTHFRVELWWRHFDCVKRRWNLRSIRASTSNGNRGLFPSFSFSLSTVFFFRFQGDFCLLCFVSVAQLRTALDPHSIRTRSALGNSIWFDLAGRIYKLSNELD